MSKEKAPYVARADIEEFCRLEEARKSLNRQAEDLARQAAPLKEKLTAFAQIKGGSDKSVERSGFVLALKTRAGRPEWKTEFIRVAGPEEAEKVIKATPPSEYLSVEKAA